MSAKRERVLVTVHIPKKETSRLRRVAGGTPAVPADNMNFPRSSGILLHPASLPGPFGIGDIGPQAYAFADFLAKLAEQEAIQIKLYSIIYNAIEEIKSAMEGMLEPGVEEKILANVEIREVYKFDKASVGGCFVLDGKMARNNRIRLVRDGIVIFTGELGSLKRFKDDAKEVTSSMECGLTIKNYNDIKVGDIVEAFEEVEVKRTL